MLYAGLPNSFTSLRNLLVSQRLGNGLPNKIKIIQSKYAIVTDFKLYFVARS